jgi:hypothetical protein
MITTSILGFLLLIANGILSYLPTVNADVITKIHETISWSIGTFMSLAYYYLPMDTINWWLHYTIDFIILIVVIKIGGNIMSSMSGGLLKPPWDHN